MATAADLINRAAQEIGTTEHPAGSNKQKYAPMAGHANGYPWCASFVVAMCRAVGIKLPNESAYTPTMAQGFKDANAWTRNPSAGDIAFFDFPDNKHRIQHVGIVVSATGSTVTCIEGNTASGIRGSQDNCGGVYRRTRPRAHVVGYGRPAFTAAPTPSPHHDLNTDIHPKPKPRPNVNLHVMELQGVLGIPADGIWGPVTERAVAMHAARQGAKGNLVSFIQKKLSEGGVPTKVDGDFGPRTRDNVKAFQRWYKLADDGIVGVQTMRKLVHL